MNKAKRTARAKAKAKSIRSGTYKPRKHKVLDEKHLRILTNAVAGRKPRKEKEDERQESESDPQAVGA